MKHSLPFLLFLIFSSFSFSQKKQYFDFEWNKTQKKHARYYRTITETKNNLYEIKDFYIENDQLQFIGYSKTNIEPFEYEGKSIWYSSNGRLIQEINFKNNLIEGNYIEYYSNGNIKYKANYKNNLKNGDYRAYFPNNEISQFATFLNGKFEGDAVSFYAKNLIELQNQYSNGIINGNYLFNNYYGNPIYKGVARNGFQNGNCFEYFNESNKLLNKTDNLKKDYNKIDGVYHGKYKQYNNNDDLIIDFNFDNDILKSGIISEVYLDFKINIQLVNDIENWNFIINNKTLAKAFYKNDQPYGDWIIYDNDGKKIIETIKNSDLITDTMIHIREVIPFYKESNLRERYDINNPTKNTQTIIEKLIQYDYLYPARFATARYVPISEYSRINNDKFIKDNNCNHSAEDKSTMVCNKNINPFKFYIYFKDETSNSGYYNEKPNDMEIYYLYDFKSNEGKFKLSKSTKEGLKYGTINKEFIVNSIISNYINYYSIKNLDFKNVLDQLEKEIRNN
ncbi:hypothetical protein [Empedobacter tilapiae]|uniref:toxin-antitoxin system YwqK family antitoxin n=1 Tax=Empedobacter tilapiae TaxID=2491114 RepID=UPI0028D459EC|nr:hypothetical protein [Empedobacter tilapiae]